MKKLIVTFTALAVLTMSLLAVSASEVDESTNAELETRNMTSEAYMETRLARLNEALANNEIEQADYDLLVAHITENSENGAFGHGPQDYEDKDCVLGEDGQLGLFRNENSGMRGGLGNGVKNQLADGQGTGSGEANKGRGNQSANKGNNGLRLQDGSSENEECILD